MKKKVQSKEKHFLKYIKKHAPFFGVFGIRSHLDENRNFVKEDLKFLVLNENLKVVFRHKPFVKGDFAPEVDKKIEQITRKRKLDQIEGKCKFSPQEDLTRMRTDDSVEELICNLFTTASLTWSGVFYKKHSEKEKEGKNLDELIELSFDRLPDEMFDIEPSSAEFEALELAINVHQFSFNFISPERTFAKTDIAYETFTEKGKKMIDECIEFVKTNKSKTPIQDAWIKLLKKNGIKPHTPFGLWCDVPVLRKIDYSPKEVIEKKWVEESERMRAKLKKINLKQ